MSIADWNRFGAPIIPTYLDARESLNVAGGSEDSKSQAFYLMGATQGAWGYLYNGPDIGDFPVRDCSISGAIRTGTYFAATQAYTGFFLRMQSLNPTSVLQLDCYFIGFTQVSTETGARTLDAWKIINGSRTHLGSTVTLPRNNSFTQFEFQVSGTTPTILMYRYNAGPLSFPGVGSWSSWIALGSDGSPGVLVNPGYAGFGQVIPGTWSSGYNVGNVIYFDLVRINKEVP